MRSKNLNLYILLIISALKPTFAMAIPEKDTGNLGEIRQPILTPDAFKNIYGDGWVPMDGRDLRDNDDLFREGLWQARKIPDARGVFLRSTNQGREPSLGNPHGDAEACGAYQADGFKSHKHGGGDHEHKIWASHSYAPQTSGDSAHDVTHGKNVILRSHSSGEIIQAEGGSETRPRCVIINTYIKIRRTEVENTQNQILTETLKNIPKRIIENEGLRTVMREIIREEVQRANEIATQARNQR